LPDKRAACLLPDYGPSIQYGSTTQTPVMPHQDDHSPLPLTINLAKPVRIFHRSVMIVPLIDLPMVCERSFISKQNVSKQRIIILQVMMCKVTKFHTIVEVISMQLVMK
jgi:hypothetical protein